MRGKCGKNIQSTSLRIIQANLKDIHTLIPFKIKNEKLGSTIGKSYCQLFSTNFGRSTNRLYMRLSSYQLWCCAVWALRCNLTHSVRDDEDVQCASIMCLRHFYVANGHTDRNRIRKIQMQNIHTRTNARTHTSDHIEWKAEYEARTQRIPCVRRQYTSYECIPSGCNQLMVNELGVCHLNLRIEWGYCVIYWVWKSSYRKIQKKKNHRTNERTGGRASERAIGCVDEPDEYEEEETNVREEEEEAQKLYVYDRLSYLFV